MTDSQFDKIQNGFFTPTQLLGNVNQQTFIINSLISKIQTATIVKVESCTNSGGLSEVGYVNVLPLVNQVCSDDSSIPHTIIHNIPYFRLQGGSNAIIIDPNAGDIGICVFSSRDISNVKKNKKQSNPGSYRQYNFADGLYIGGILNGTPTQYISFSSDGIKLNSSSKITIEAPNIALKGNVECTKGFTQNGTESSSFSGSLSISGINYSTHKHNGVMNGDGNTGGPIS